MHPPHNEDVFNNFLMYSNFDGDFLPPYSPMLTPIEEAISLIKNSIRTQLNYFDRIKLLNLINAPRGQKLLEEAKYLKMTISKAMPAVTRSHMIGYISHVQSFYTKVMNMESL